MNHTIYAVIQSDPNFFGIDANIKLYEKEQDAKHKLEQDLKTILENIEKNPLNTFNTTITTYRKNIYHTFLKNQKQNYLITDHKDTRYEGFLTKLTIKDDKPDKDNTQHTTKKLDELCYYHDLIKLTLNKARIAANESNPKKEKETINNYIQSLGKAIQMATELNNGITKENRKPYTIWAVITETERFGKANIQLYHQHKNAKGDLAKTLWNLLTKENNKTGLSPEEKKIWHDFVNDKSRILSFGFEDKSHSQMNYGKIMPITVNV